jgi:sugar/nucleoside kinase (ribokinase family)
VTSFDSEIPLTSLDGITVISFPTERSTTFENLYKNRKRVQYLRYQAPSLDYYQIPETWRNPSIVHLGPVAQEVEPNLVRNFPTSLVGVTPQGWLRNWNDDGKVFLAEWPEAAFVLERAGAAVISIDDLEGDEKRIDELALSCRVLAVTESDQGARVYWNGDVRRFRTPDVEEVDPTGAGDIFAAAFFSRLLTTRDPWEAARFATVLSAISVTRSGLAGIPTSDEINNCLVEVF